MVRDRLCAPGTRQQRFIISISHSFHMYHPNSEPKSERIHFAILYTMSCCGNTLFFSFFFFFISSKAKQSQAIENRWNSFKWKHFLNWLVHKFTANKINLEIEYNLFVYLFIHRPNTDCIHFNRTQILDGHCIYSAVTPTGKSTFTSRKSTF